VSPGPNRTTSRPPPLTPPSAVGEPPPYVPEQTLGGLVRISTVATTLGVSLDTLRRWERQGRIVFQRQGQSRYIPAGDLAALLKQRSVPRHTSARNRLLGTVVAVKKDGVMAQIDMACGQFRIVSLMSREAADELDLKPGDQAIAVVKSTTVVVETR
jgi:molybdopterin-binding protein